ncbi:MAG: CpcT/CpeT family chromophore lyase [Steroidobacteraceae bacterium]
MASRTAGRLRAAALIAAGALGGGCADQSKHDEADMLGLLTLLPGNYDNSEQADLEARNHARPAHIGVALVVTRVYTPRLGHNVYYAQETAADDPRRVLSQKMYSFKVEDKRGIVETLYPFVDPLRWRDGQQNPDMFTGLVIDDVQAEGCQLLWKKSGDGFVAAHDPKVCPDVPGAPGSKVELGAETLTLGDYKFVKSH